MLQILRVIGVLVLGSLPFSLFSLAVGASLSRVWLRRYVASRAKARTASSGVS